MSETLVPIGAQVRVQSQSMLSRLEKAKSGTGRVNYASLYCKAHSIRCWGPIEFIINERIRDFQPLPADRAIAWSVGEPQSVNRAPIFQLNRLSSQEKQEATRIVPQKIGSRLMELEPEKRKLRNLMFVSRFKIIGQLATSLSGVVKASQADHLSCFSGLWKLSLYLSMGFCLYINFI